MNVSAGTIVTAIAMLVSASTTLAQTGGGYDLTWSTIDGRGATSSTRSGYDLGGTVGQPDAGLLRGGGYTLAGGFWIGGALAMEYGVYLPLVLRNGP